MYDEDVQDWWGYPGTPDVKRSKVAWKGSNPAAVNFGEGIMIRLFSSAWANPHPEKEVATVDYMSKATECKPFLVALTLEQG